MSKEIVMTLKKEWFDAIFYGDKREEYREIKPYWTRRLLGYWPAYADQPPKLKGVYTMPYGVDRIRFKNGYSKDAREFTIEWKEIQVNTPVPAWCPKDTDYTKFVYVLRLGSIISTNIKTPAQQ